MSRLFDNALEEYLQIESPVITAYPFAMVCKFRSNDDAAAQALMFVGDKDVPNYYTGLILRGDVAGDYIVAFSHSYGGASSQQAVTSSGYTANTWHHACGIWVGASERRALIDSGGKGTNTDAVNAMQNHDRTAIGMLRDSSVAAPMSGEIAEAAIYDLSVWPGATDSDKADAFEKILPSLAKGFTPDNYPLGLKAYWPLV